MTIICPDGSRSINEPVSRAELRDAEEEVVRAERRLSERREELKRAEDIARTSVARLSRLRRAIAKSGLVD